MLASTSFQSSRIKEVTKHSNSSTQYPLHHYQNLPRSTNDTEFNFFLKSVESYQLGKLSRQTKFHNNFQRKKFHSIQRCRQKEII